MGLDTSIALQTRPVQLENPLEVQQRVLTLRQLQNQGQLQGLAVQQQQETFQRAQRLRDLLGGMPADTTDENRINALRGAGYFDEADKLQTGILARKKTDAEVGHLTAQTAAQNATAQKTQLDTLKARLDASSNILNSLLSRPQVTHQDVYQAIAGMTNSGIIDQERGAQLARELPGDPSQLRPFLMQKGMEVMSAKDRIEALTPKLQTVNLGGTEQIVDMNPNTRGTAPTTFRKTMTPGEAAQDARAGQRLAFDQQQAAQGVTYQQDADGNFVALPTKVAPGTVVKATPVAAPGPGLQPLAGKSSLTEDQGKASGWLAQANNAYTNALAAVNKNPSALTPGIGDAVSRIPLMGPAGNFLTGEDRQRFNQAMSSMSEAMLRAATGAGINEYEARQKVAELTPQFGDSQAVIKQKMDSIPVYLKALEMRAGPGAKKVGAAAVPIKSDDDYAKLPSGTRFQAPDGTVRVKP